MTEHPSHPRGSAEARAAVYWAKAAALRERAASAWDVTSATFIQAAETYEYMATTIEALAERRCAPFGKRRS